MLPILIGIAIGIAGAIAGAIAEEIWDKIVIFFKGKRVAVFGARGVGKTHLIKFLTTGTIPAEYKQTIAPEKAPSRRFSLKELGIKVKETQDLSGDKAAYAEWKKLHDEADVVFYLLRADRLIAGDVNVETRVRDDLRHISEWLEKRNPRPLFFIIGTHCDLDTEFRTLTADKIGDYNDKFCRLPIVRELVTRAGGAQQTKVVLGSMKTPQDTETLVYQVFMQVAS